MSTTEILEKQILLFSHIAPSGYTNIQLTSEQTLTSRSNVLVASKVYVASAFELGFKADDSNR